MRRSMAAPAAAAPPVEDALLECEPCVDEEGRVCGQITQRAMTHHLGARFRTKQRETSAVAAEPKE